MEINKESILKLMPEFLKSLEDEAFKSTLLEAKKNPEILQNPLAIMTIVLPKLSEILKKNGFTEPNAPQLFFQTCLLNQMDPDIKNAFEILKAKLN